MRKYFFVVLLVVVLATLAIGLTLMGPAAAFPQPTWANGCDDCHGGAVQKVAPPAHTVAAHLPLVCSNCHTGAANATTVQAANCLVCHPVSDPGSRDGLAAAHADDATCTGTGCHPLDVAQTTTTVGATTTTVGGTTTTVVGGTTTTVQQTTTTRSTVSPAASTTTTLKTAAPSFTG